MRLTSCFAGMAESLIAIRQNTEDLLKADDDETEDEDEEDGDKGPSADAL